MKFPELRRFHVWVREYEGYEDLRENMDALINRIKAPGLCPNIESITISTNSMKFNFSFAEGMVLQLPADHEFDDEWLQWPLLECKPKHRSVNRSFIFYRNRKYYTPSQASGKILLHVRGHTLKFETF